MSRKMVKTCRETVLLAQQIPQALTQLNLFDLPMTACWLSHISVSNCDAFLEDKMSEIEKLTQRKLKVDQ